MLADPAAFDEKKKIRRRNEVNPMRCFSEDHVWTTFFFTERVHTVKAF